jgi:hypothetical protein
MKLVRIVAVCFFLVNLHTVSAQTAWSQLGGDIVGSADGDGLGATLSISADGTIVAVGAPSADAGGSSFSTRGLVKVYAMQSGSWVQIGSTINGTEDGASFGASVSLSDDGTLLAIGAPHSASTFGEFSNSGQMKIYSWDGLLSDWSLETTVEAEAAGDNFGYAISISGDGSVIAVGAPISAAGGDSRGRVRVYDWNGSSLSSREDLNGATDFEGFGTAVSLNLDGSVLAVGAPSKNGSGGELIVGQVTSYSWNTTNYSNTGTLNGVAEYDSFGDEVSMSDDGTRLAVGVTKFFGGTSYVELFDFSTSWSSIGVINSANDTDGFGSSISLSGDGSHIAIGASANVTGSEGGRAEVYAYTGATWEKVDVDLTGDAAGDGAGTAVSISADGAFVAVGAPNNVAGGVNAGQVKVFEQALPDLSAPTVAITSNEGEITNNSPFAITITFSEEVTGFVIGDIAVANGAAGNFATSDNTTFTADITPTADGTVTVNIAAAVAQDLGSNANTAAEEFNIVYDGTAPVVTIDALVTNDQTPALTGTIDDNTATIIVTVGDETNEATNHGDGTWTLADNTLSSLAEAEYTVNATATDGLNESDEATALLTIDLTGPQIFFDNANLDGLAPFTDPVNISPLIVNIFFTEEATGLTLGEITIDGNVGTTGLSEVQESGVNFYMLAVPLQNESIDQEITITIPAGAAFDQAGNPNQEGSVTISYDITGPSVSSISTVGQSTTNASPIAVQIQFSEKITELAAEDFTVGNGTIEGTPSSEDNITFTLNITPVNEGLVTIQLLADAVEDIAGNTNALGSDVFEMTYDITQPTVEISTQSAATATSPIVATVTFSEAMDPIAPGDFTVTGGTVSGINTTGVGVYSLEVTPNPLAEGSTSTAGVEMTIALAAGKVQDVAGNTNTASNTLAVIFDDQPPVFNLFNDASQPLTAVSGNFTANFVITESASLFDINDITVTNGTKSNFRSESIFGFTRYRVDIALTGSEGVTITIPAGAVADAAGNENAETTFSIAVDNIGPTVTISSSASSPTKVNPIPVTFSFSEEVTGFTMDDIAANNFTVTAQPSSDDNITFSTTIAPTANGELTIALKDGSVTDVAGNPLTNTGAFAITYDNVAPTLTIDGPNAVNTTDPFTLTLNFSEPISGLTADNFTIAGATAGTITATSTSIYTVPLTPQQPGTISVVVKGFADLAGNANADGVAKSILFDNTRPTVAISGTPASPVNSKNPIKFTFTFSEVVTGFTMEDISVSNATASNFTGSNAEYTADITPTTPGTITVSLAGNVAVDAARNGNQGASVSFVFNQKYSGGSGTEADPYLIATEADLRKISSNTEDARAHFRQTADILMSNASYNPISSFYGVYDGQGFEIQGLTNIVPEIQRGTLYGDIGLVGLFIYTNGAILKNISLTAINIQAYQGVNVYSGAGLSVEATNTRIENCFVTGNIKGPANVGGLVGSAEGLSVIANSFTDIEVFTGPFPTLSVGGLILSANDAGGGRAPLITDSYSLGNYSAPDGTIFGIGGLVVELLDGSKINNSFYAGTINSTSGPLGGLLKSGTSTADPSLEITVAEVNNSFWDKEWSGLETSALGGSGLTTSQMKTLATYTVAGWDFTNTWEYVWNSYPRLKWQKERHNKPFKISGKVLDENGNPFTNGTVNAFSFDGPKSVSVTPDASGNYSLALETGEYFLSVFPNDFNKYYRTYLGNTNRLDKSRVVFYENIHTIQMVPNSPDVKLNGNGRVSGRVVQSTNGGRIVQGRVLEGNPLEGVTVMLIRVLDQEVMTSVQTDANGDFEITGIPTGSYQLVLGVDGVDLNLEGSTFTMDEAGTPIVISAAVGEDGITFAIEKVLGIEDEIALSIYPNPAQDHINIVGKGQMSVRVLSLSGDVVSDTAFTDQITIDLGSLPQAMYLLEITNNSQQRTVRRIVKSN